jgi:hypothetical protein
MDEKGVIIIWLEKLFGRSWKTSLLGIMVLLPQIFSLLQEWIVDIGVTPAKMNSISLLFAALAAIAAKAQGVSGANRTETTGVPGPKETGKDPLCEETKKGTV